MVRSASTVSRSRARRGLELLTSRLALGAVLSCLGLLLVGACGANTGLSGGAGGAADGAVAPRGIEVLPETLLRGRTRRAYAETLHAIGGVGAPYVFTITAGALPPGLTLTSSGALAGTPTRAGTYVLTVQARDAAGGTGERTYTLVVEGPRWMAHLLFVSTTSVRSALALLDVTEPGSSLIYLSEDRANDPVFSPDGRLLSYTNGRGGGGVDAFVVDVDGETPGTPFALHDTGYVAPGRTIVWSPDSTRIAYVGVDGGASALWVAEVSGTGVSRRTKIAADVSPREVGWYASGALTFYDSAKRPSLVRFVGGAQVRTTFDLPDGSFAALSPDAAVALLYQASSGYVLGDVASGSTSALPVGFDRWDASPAFDLLVGRVQASEAYALYGVVGAMPGSVRGSGDGVNFYASLSWAGTQPLLAQSEHGRIAVTAYGGATATRTELPGAYSDAREPLFAYDASRLAFHDPTAIWAADVSGTVVSPPVVVDALGGAPHLSFAPGAPLLLVEAGTPVTLHLLDLAQVAAPIVQGIPLDVEWTETAWSTDSSRIAVLGGKTGTGRFLYLVDAAAPMAMPRVVSSCNSVPSAPRCPGGVRFQP